MLPDHTSDYTVKIAIMPLSRGHDLMGNQRVPRPNGRLSDFPMRSRIVWNCKIIYAKDVHYVARAHF